MTTDVHRDGLGAVLDCVHCGLCLPACPTYEATGREEASPRGRLLLMRMLEEGGQPGEGAGDVLADCVLCRACEPVCPSGVQFGTAMEAAREILAGQGDLPRPWWLGAALRRLARAGRVPRTLGWLSRLGIPRRLEPRGRLRRTAPTTAPVQSAARAPVERLLLFDGCVMPDLFPGAHAATRTLLEAAGHQVVVQPGGRSCCGALHAHFGEGERSAALGTAALESLRVSGAERLVVHAAGCGAHLKGALGALVMDVMEVLHEALIDGRLTFTREFRGTVAVHDPCHHLHAQGIAHQTRQLLAEVPGLEVVPFPGAGSCCGAGGLYAQARPGMAGRIEDLRERALHQLDARWLASANPGCLMQWRKLSRRGGPEPVHPVWLLARAL